VMITVDGEPWILDINWAPIVEQPMTWLEMLMHRIVDSTIVAILMTIGVQAIIFELANPGTWFPGFVGVVSLALGLYGLGILPVNWLGLGLLIVAFVLFILDIKAPSHGALTAAGILTLISGFVILFNYPGSPQFARVSIPVVVGIGLMTGAVFAFIVAKAVSAQQRQPTTGQEGLINAPGTVRVALEPVGTVLVKGERWRASSASGLPLPAGTLVKVVGVQGFQLIVEQIDNNE
jgi:membrane-bound serine protease (ClpP class)